MTDIMLSPFGWVIAFGLYGFLLVIGDWVIERWDAHAARRDRQLRAATRRHPSTGGRR